LEKRIYQAKKMVKEAGNVIAPLAKMAVQHKPITTSTPIHSILVCSPIILQILACSMSA